MQFIKTFKQLRKIDTGIAGGKGASLGELVGAGIPVPPGFVVMLSAFDTFLLQNELQVDIEAVMDTVNPNEMQTVENASEQIRELILNTEMPAYIAKAILSAFGTLKAKTVAVRSSALGEDGAETSWAGMFDTYLHVYKKDVLQHVKMCWASLYTPRAIHYRFGKKTTQKPSVAVVVQKMIESEVSGVAFSVHPVTEDANQILIEAGFGLGEAIVSGEITPDHYVIHKKDFTIIDKHISEQDFAIVRAKGGGTRRKKIPRKAQAKQKISDVQIQKLATLVKGIEKHYGFPCDIEWAKEGIKFYILQSRPITTLQKQP